MSHRCRIAEHLQTCRIFVIDLEDDGRVTGRIDGEEIL